MSTLPVPLTEEMQRYYIIFAKLRVLALYQTASDDYMVLIYQDGKYRISFIDQHGLATQTTTLISTYDDISARMQARLIARLTDAMLIEDIAEKGGQG